MVKKKNKNRRGDGAAPMDTGGADGKAKNEGTWMTGSAKVYDTEAGMDTSEIVAGAAGVVTVGADAPAGSKSGGAPAGLRLKGKRLAPVRKALKVRKQKAFEKALAVQERKQQKARKDLANQDRKKSLKTLY